jgi:hypothetical protein
MSEPTLRVPDSPLAIAAGAPITWFTPTATDGDEFANTTGTVMVIVRNDHATLPTTVTVDCPQPCSRGYFHDIVAVADAETTWASTILAADLFADPVTGKTLIICTAVTDVLMALIQLSFVPNEVE